MEKSSHQPQAKQAKIVKLNKLTKPTLTVTDDDDYVRPVMTTINPVRSEIASIRKRLSTITSPSSLGSSFEKSFDTSKSISDESDDNDVSGEYLTKLYVIKNHFGQLAYGDLNVRRGDCVYLISESDTYCFVENDQGIQGFVPKDICIDLDEMIRKAKLQYSSSDSIHCKITSL